MDLIYVLLGFGVGFCFGSAHRIGVEVRRKGSWNNRDSQECVGWLFCAYAGCILTVSLLFLQ